MGPTRAIAQANARLSIAPPSPDCLNWKTLQSDRMHFLENCMRRTATRLLTLAVAGSFICFITLNTSAATAPHYLITNNDFSQGNSATFYSISSGTLTQAAVVSTGGKGEDGLGSVATKRITILHNPTQSCAFVADAGSNDVAGISITSLTATGTFPASSGDNSSFSLPVTNNGSYLYAGFTGSGTIGTYQILSGCKLQFLADAAAVGLAGGAVLDMQAVKNILVVSFEDGSIESFNISAGVAVSNGDLQFSTGHAQSNFVAGVDIDATAHYAAFGGTLNPAVIEISDISSGKLTPTIVYSNLGPNTGSEAVWFSPNDQWLYFSGFNSQKVSAANFNNLTGNVTVGCTSTAVRGGADVAGLATSLPSGDGSILYVAEPDTSIGILRVTQSKPACEFTETSKSPVHDGNTITLESIAVFPPRRF